MSLAFLSYYHHFEVDETHPYGDDSRLISLLPGNRCVLNQWALTEIS
jgi:hypothetical protein